MAKKQRPRCKDWRGQVRPEARAAAADYEWHMRRYWATDGDWYYVPAMPEEERKGEA